MRKLLFFCLCFALDIVSLAVIFNNVTTYQNRNIANSIPKSAQAQEISLNDYFAKQGTPDVLGVSKFSDVIESSAIPSAVPKNAKTTKIAVTQPVKSVSNQPSQLTIAVLGDSMVDTLGPEVPDLKTALQAKLPNTKLTVINHGVGASNIDYGITRLTNDYTYLSEARSSVLSTKPDILVIESFAYNHWENNQSDINRHWLTMANLVKLVKSGSPKTKIVFASTVAPFCPTYTDGSANLAPDQKYIQCQTVKVYLQNTVNFATSEKYPLADVFHASLSGTDGNPKYINSGDHIHPSDEGKSLFAKIVAETILSVL
ncbi:MAG: hypothetical protein UT84_C0009G0023 [Candidatus Curtissbacteria bacterium GW2011_GWA1_40_16]|uniref:SGNH hydrolase-type esterase domain-containing protein n=1 Tax=Candidatus Curtissbacteria bacterium GW2011_GWA1_40_16 TaxID=1618405 RepID=A0A0G0RLA0_9BACT|nr:MAG: hypothetical protein UT84_C0009G0023 [Candidatus Curtissbacteria bacterium GW2011_GWA1_40_16]